MQWTFFGHNYLWVPAVLFLAAAVESTLEGLGLAGTVRPFLMGIGAGSFAGFSFAFFTTRLPHPVALEWALPVAMGLSVGLFFFSTDRPGPMAGGYLKIKPSSPTGIVLIAMGILILERVMN